MGVRWSDFPSTSPGTSPIPSVDGSSADSVTATLDGEMLMKPSSSSLSQYQYHHPVIVAIALAVDKQVTNILDSYLAE